MEAGEPGGCVRYQAGLRGARPCGPRWAESEEPGSGQLGGNLALQGLALFVQQMSPQEKNHKYLPCEINPTRTN